MSGLWLAIGIGIGGVALVLLGEWLIARGIGKRLHRDDGTADRQED